MTQSCVIPGGIPVILGGAITIDSYMIPMNIFASVSSSEKVHQSINQLNSIMSASNNGSFEQVSANWNTQYNTATNMADVHIGSTGGGGQQQRKEKREKAMLAVRNYLLVCNHSQ